MNLGIGIVGLPNVGKSTLFNALLKKQQALVANYPFATIEPNVGVVAVPDARLEKLAGITMNEEKMGSLPPLKPATVNFVDIAGLVKGASEGAGLGNKFLSHIREVSVIAHVVRVFSDPDVIRYQDEKEARLPALERSDSGQGSVDPKADYETINTELILADIQTLTKTLENRKLEPHKKSGAEKLLESLNSGKRAFDVILTDEEKDATWDMFLLTNKPEIIVLNVAEDEYMGDAIGGFIDKWSEVLGMPKEKFVVISAKIEAELASLSEEEQLEYLKDLGLAHSGLERLIQKAYEELGLISFLTCGEKEVRAWTMKKGLSAQMAAGEIHTDFIKKFIKAEVVSFNDFVDPDGCGGPARNGQPCVAGGWKGARENGKARMEGRDYIMHDGDVVEFKIGS